MKLTQTSSGYSADQKVTEYKKLFCLLLFDPEKAFDLVEYTIYDKSTRLI